MATTTASVRQRPHERHDRWWVEPLTIVLVLGGFVVYSLIVSIQNANYFADPYLSPFYSPCLTTGCIHPTFPIIGDWYSLSPAFLIVGSPLAFRVTCYYYRRSYYRAFFWSPPACTVPDARAKYSGETRFPWVIQNIHRYALYLAILVLAILWWDAIEAFNFDGHFGIGVGTLIMLVNIILLTIYTFSCHSLRHLMGGKLDCFSCATLGAPRESVWRGITKLNEHHMFWAWVSMISVGLTDLYIRMVASGALKDIRIL